MQPSCQERRLLDAVMVLDLNHDYYTLVLGCRPHAVAGGFHEGEHTVAQLSCPRVWFEILCVDLVSRGFDFCSGVDGDFLI